jgi:hypothetical protein
MVKNNVLFNNVFLINHTVKLNCLCFPIQCSLWNLNMEIVQTGNCFPFHIVLHIAVFTT